MMTMMAMMVMTAFSSASHATQCYAIDGDTLRCGAQRVRLSNVYAAEIKEAGGIDAKQNLAALVNGQEVTIQRVATDKYGRTLAKVSVNGHEIVQSDIGAKAGRGTKGYVIAAGNTISTANDIVLKQPKLKKIRQPKQPKPFNQFKASKFKFKFATTPFEKTKATQPHRSHHARRHRSNKN